MSSRAKRGDPVKDYKEYIFEFTSGLPRSLSLPRNDSGVKFNKTMKKDFFSTTKLPPYIFEAINQSKARAVAKGLDIIDFGMGNPDMSPPKSARKLLGELVQDPSLYGYSDVGGIEDLKKAHCSYYKKRFNVDLDPKKESIATIGAKEGLTSLAVALSGGDDYIVTLDPSYPIHSFAFVIAKINAVHPSLFIVLTSAPASINSLKHSLWSFANAHINAESLL